MSVMKIMRYYRIILTPPSSFCDLDLEVRLMSAVMGVVESDSPRQQAAVSNRSRIGTN
jgi:hypothetical protein